MIFDSLGVTVLYIGIILLFLIQKYVSAVLPYKRALLLFANIFVLAYLIPPVTILTSAAVACICYTVAVYFQKNRVDQQKSLRSRLALSRGLLLGTLAFLILWWIVIKYNGPKEFLRSWHFQGLADTLGLTGAIGLSYIFFKLVHVLVDSYRGVLPELNPVTFLNYLFFFPTFLSGPIDRYQNFSHWLKQQSFRNQGLLARAAFFRIFEGVVKKFILVPLLIPYAKDFGQVHISDFFWINMAVSLFAYSFYLYFDFSGYSDLAIGIAMMLGFKVPENFNAPYLAGDIGEFWKRWHISLSSVLKEYIFLPLVRLISKHFARVPRLAGTVFGYLTTFLLCGLWHGNGLNFVFWGLWHGLGLSVHKLWSQTALSRELQPMNGKVARVVFTVLSVGATFCYVSLGWLFFNYSVPQIREIRDIAKLKISAEPYYFYGDTYTWGIKLKYQPISSRGKIDLDIRAKGNDWIRYADDVAVDSGQFDVYGIKGRDSSSYDNLSPGRYELRVSYLENTFNPDSKSNSRPGGIFARIDARLRCPGKARVDDYQEEASYYQCSVILPVTVPEYTRYATLTADDLQAKVYRASEEKWIIKLKYHPPTYDAKVDIEYRPLGSNLWMRYEEQRPGRFRFAHITGEETDRGIVKSLRPGVYCIRIRYTNSKKGYFSDWTEISVHVPNYAEPDGDGKDEFG